MMKIQNKTIYLIFLILILSCKDTKNKIPYVYVNFTISLDDPKYSSLRTVGHSISLRDVGVKGIIIYRNTHDDFLAFERNSTFEPQNGCIVDVIDPPGGITAIDSCSGSMYLLTNGQPVEGPASIPLKQYGTSFNDPFLHVFN